MSQNEQANGPSELECHRSTMADVITALASIGEEGNLRAADYDPALEGVDLVGIIEGLCFELVELRSNR